MPINVFVRIAGFAFSFLGVIVIALSILQLNKNLSPFPSPKKDGDLVMNGLYSLVRHPIYLGILILFSGYSLYSEDGFRLMVSILLAFLFHYKSTYEEKLLMAKFDDYESYQKSTSKIIPFL